MAQPVILILVTSYCLHQVYLTNYHSPCTIPLGPLCANCDSDNSNDASQCWDDEMDQMMPWLMNTTVAASKPYVNFIGTVS